MKTQNTKKRLRARADKLWKQACVEEWGEECNYCGKIGVPINPYDPMDNIRCANWLIIHEGAERHWAPSKHCWDK